MTTLGSATTRADNVRERADANIQTGWPLIIYNDDSCSLRYVDEPHTEEALELALRHIAGTQVGALCWLLGEDMAYSWPSRVMENYYDMLAKGKRVVGFDDETGFSGKGGGCNGIDPGEDPRNVMLSLHRQGIDYLPAFIRRTHQKGIKFYGSFRMNDCHLKSDPTGLFSTRFWQEHQDYRLWEVVDGRTYYNAALDYSFPEVRERRLSAIQETLDWYDLDGVELDFSRNPYIFQPSEAWEKRDILTQFVRQIRQKLDAAGRRKERNLHLVVRTPFSEEKLRAAGMDVEKWLDEKLIDALVMTSLFNDCDQTLEPWLSRCGRAGIAFYPSTEMSPAHNAVHNHITIETVEEIVLRQRAMAQNFIAQGAAGVYMFNYPCLITQVRRTPRELSALTGIFSEIGQAGTLKGKAMQYTFWKNLPLQLESRRPAQFHQTIDFHLFDSGITSGADKVEISFRVATELNPHSYYSGEIPAILPPGWITFWLNGGEVPESWIRRESQPGGKIASGFSLGEHEKISITPPVTSLKPGKNGLGFFIPKFPEEKDPYVNIYEMLVDVVPPERG